MLTAMVDSAIQAVASAFKTTTAPPPPPRRWYVRADAKTYGPYDVSEIARMVERRQVIGSDRVFAEGGGAWAKASDDPILGNLFSKVVDVAEPRNSLVKAEHTDRRRTWSFAKWGMIGLAIVVAWKIASMSTTTVPTDTERPVLAKQADHSAVSAGGCGSRGGPGYRLNNGKCASWEDQRRGRH
jgi:hypothetical protein